LERDVATTKGRLIKLNEDYEAYISAMMAGNAKDDPSNPLVYDTNGNVRSKKQLLPQSLAAADVRPSGNVARIKD
jgi:hypothetical protein